MEFDSLNVANANITINTRTSASTATAENPEFSSGIERVERQRPQIVRSTTNTERSAITKPPTEVSEESRNAIATTTIGNAVEYQKDVSNEYFEKVLAEANKKIFNTNRELSYSYHEKTNRVIVKVLDKTTREIIREIPPEKSLDAVAKMWELVGVIVDEKI